MKKIFFIVILILEIILIFYYCKKYTGVSPYNKGYGHKNDSVSVLLERIDWSNHYKGRDNMYIRNLAYSIIIVFIVLSVINNGFPEIQHFLQGVFIMFLLLQAFYNYFQYHSEKFAHYAIDRNIKIIRKKLKLKKDKINKIWFNNFPSASSCWNFLYKNY